MRLVSLILCFVLCHPLAHAWEVDERCMINATESPSMSPAIGEPLVEVEASALYLQRQNIAFQLKIYWEEGFCWQQEWIERKWCMSCQYGTCDENDIMWVQECSDDDIQLFVWEAVGGTGGGRLKPFTRQDLCFENTSNNSTLRMSFFKLRPCDENNKDSQIITGLTQDAPFELYPFGQSMYQCISQQHHPKPMEELRGQLCSVSIIVEFSSPSSQLELTSSPLFAGCKER